MTNYEKLVEALRFCFSQSGHGCGLCPYKNHKKPCDAGLLAADAIEVLQAEVQFYKELAYEWKSSAENKERLLWLYRTEQAK